MNNVTAILALGLGLWVAADIALALHRGKARGRGTTVTRTGSPARFRRYLIGDAIVLAGCIGVLVWWLIG